MEESMTEVVLKLYRLGKWKEIVEKYHDHKDRNKLLWVFPSEDNFEFLKECLKEFKCKGVASVGCGSGLLEWMLQKATGISVTGIEVDGAWWHCKYAPPTFIPLIVTSPQLNEDVLLELGNKDNAILFCYFNNRSAFENYLKHFCGPVLVIIGPDQGKGVYTEPGPFEKILGWELYKWREVRQSKDFLSVYFRRVEVDS
ncbi:uncharacterized protein LOC101743729 [Bombyx mori]|uniref:Uncharacterized protein n=1 Tax=Bombyx mori TaxID=7091 RepID=A0A8R2AKA4_BOMMO|nr:uncharacterized protein LOC101743729 [Bombyx mori]